MNHTELAQKLIETDENKRIAYLKAHLSLADNHLAYILKNICHDVWHNDPEKARAATASLISLSAINNDKEIIALQLWSKGLVALSESKLELALKKFDEAQKEFEQLNLKTQSASVQANKVVALAILGRYEEAVECGSAAIEILKVSDEKHILGNLEYNLGNLFLRRNHFEEAKHYFKRASETAASSNNQSLLARIKNSLALINSSQNYFRQAEELYKEALISAEATNQILLQADIEANIGELSYFQGRYDTALNYLEKSRRRFFELGNEQRSALIALEIADAYLELNLHAEALTSYKSVINEFEKLGMRAEQARVYAQTGRALSYLKEFSEAQISLEKAAKLYASENNTIGEALTKLSLAQMFSETNHYQKAFVLAEEAEEVFTLAKTWRHTLTARMLRGEIEFINGNQENSKSLLKSTLFDANKLNQPQIEQRCLTSLGLLAAKDGKSDEAETFFKQSIDLIENLRAPLPGEEFSTAFFSDKLAPYHEMARICLTDDNRIEEALSYIEKARSRALADKLGQQIQEQPRDIFEAGIFEELQQLREELNWFYTQIERTTRSSAENISASLDSLNEAVKERETKIAELLRQLKYQTDSRTTLRKDAIDFQSLRNLLGNETILIEYAILDDEWLAFIVTNEGIKVKHHLGTVNETQELIENFHFQIGSLSHGAASLRNHLPLLTKRVNTLLKQLYEILIEPLEDIQEGKRIVIIPHKQLHYVPFHALFDGQNYLLEKHEISYSPSALILEHSLSKQQKGRNFAVLFGVSDERAPRVRDEIETLTPLFSEGISFIDEKASITEFKSQAPNAGILHVACHGQFRQDNPLFSTLKLGDGWLTVHDISRINLQCDLVTLSACETGVNLIAPGDELLGMMRGFFSAGASSLILSLWTVDDDATTDLMQAFYKKLCAGFSTSFALQQAQIELLREKKHPYFWAPFILIGHW